MKFRKSNIRKTNQRKLGVVLSQRLHPFLSMALLSVIYSDFSLSPISHQDADEDSFNLNIQNMTSPFIHADKEIINPGFVLFDSSVFVLNYSLFHC